MSSSSPSTSSTSAPGASLLPDSTDAFTAAHLALIAVLVLLVIAAIVFGIRLARRRHQATDELREHNAQVREHAPPEAAAVEAAPAAEPAAQPPPPPEPPQAPAPAEPPRVEPVARPSPAPAGPVAPPSPAGAPEPDGPVTQLKGLGSKVAERLATLGITTVGQLAALSDDEAQALDARLGPFTGRMNRDRWQEQARFLAAGDRAGFEAVFGRL